MGRSPNALSARDRRTCPCGGHDVALLPADEVGSVEPYHAVVIGSALYMGRWRPDAVRLLKRQQELLALRPVWLFHSGEPDVCHTGDRPREHLDDVPIRDIVHLVHNGHESPRHRHAPPVRIARTRSRS
ncbi:flavodoxin domain-containing protein [Lentzea tibetensis]|uniref:flavodoxin domain-containing protein n=1 Tax=Lentzea tibetensis TaxID=2591470 RepID=UPI001F443FAA|nr:flavodoxin domain-containing protein [Lentzea tibetensis]